jgi:hypothetical protein
MKTTKLGDGREVLVAEKNGRTLRIERLLNLAGQYGTATAYGLLFKASKEQLDAHLRFIFGVKEIEVVRQTLVA